MYGLSFAGPGRAALSVVLSSAALLRALGRAIATVVVTVQAWHLRAEQRRGLAAMSDHLLRDIGLDRGSAYREVHKPFWRN